MLRNIMDVGKAEILIIACFHTSEIGRTYGKCIISNGRFHSSWVASNVFSPAWMQQQHVSPHRKLRRNHIALKKMWDVNWQVKQHSDNFLPATRCTYHRVNLMQSMQSWILHVFILLHMGLFPKNMEIISQMSLSASPHRVDHCLIYWYFVMSCQIVWCAIIILSQAAKMFMRTMGISSLQNPRACLRDDPCATMGRSLVFGLPGILSHLKYCWWFLSCALVERIAPLIQTKIFCSTHFESTAGWQLDLNQILADLRNGTESFTSGTPKRGWFIEGITKIFSYKQYWIILARFGK